jgi:serine/threonine-protein kinase
MGEPADYRSDIFSFGVILYEMVCGRRPFQGGDLHTTLRQIVYKEPDPVGEGVPGNASDLISKCLRKKREERLPSMAEAVALLSSSAPLRLPVSRSRGRVAALAGGLVVLGIAGSLLWSAAGRRTSETHPIAAVSAGLDSVDGTSSELTIRARSLLRRYDKTGYMDRAIALLERALEKDRKFAPAYAAIAEAYLRKGHSITSSDNHWLKLARDSANQAVLANPDLAAAHTILGDVLLEAGESAQAKTEIDRALQLDPLNSTANVSLAKFHSKSDPARAEVLFRKAAVLAAPDDWIPHSEYGGFLYRAARYQDAAAEWEKAGRAAPDNVFMLRNLGAAYHMLDQFEKSASALQKALEIEPSAAVWNNLGTARFFQGNYAESVAAFEKAVELNSTNYLNWGNLGDAYRWAPGQRNKAGRAYEHAIALVRDLIVRDPHDSQPRGWLAVYLARSGDAGGARNELAQLASDPDIRPEDHFRMALTYEVLGNRESALQALEKAIRGGYSLREIRNEPELAALRSDVRYQDLISPAPAPK